ncbi:hypothetical protein EDD21DRAFT_139474 [Dissophora ornata]|nr:hypothetical protein EDD21DRAFT_139474 [Dissophora ornata]
MSKNARPFTCRAAYLILTMPLLNFSRARLADALLSTDSPASPSSSSAMLVRMKPSVSSSSSISMDSASLGASASRPPLPSMAWTARFITCARQCTCCLDALNGLLQIIAEITDMDSRSNYL